MLFDTRTELVRHSDTPQLFLYGAKDAFLEGVFAGAGGASLEMRAHVSKLARMQFPIEKLVHAAKGFFAAVSIQW
jgi:hypothetical protein